MNRHLQIRGPLIQAAQRKSTLSTHCHSHLLYIFPRLSTDLFRNRYAEKYGHQILIKCPLTHKLTDRLLCIIIAFAAAQIFEND